jgi:anti-anti-sigma regulatory factor
MGIVVTQRQGRVPVTVLQPSDRIDGSNYTEIVARAQEEYAAGGRCFLVDLSQVSYVSSAALVALHKIALLTLHGILPDEESGWEAFRAIERDAQGGYQPYLKLLKPQPRVESVLSMSGMDQYLQVFTDEQDAIGAF